ncbi:MAG: nucleotide exchange factor GrpE [Jaaginema sp. PMC 1079.18]|nr:nucleotide exchange factor GrpE [Jaaginema sp. PMC 1080.18]MEC4850392.1 nucleotide exchange factor GrpE [Jaaginema sp. PMC 1079.18]MEC4866296.1 nucleotide exchange factor GrpE [Jaaginema sp. PMC 1078.18]
MIDEQNQAEPTVDRQDAMIEDPALSVEDEGLDNEEKGDREVSETAVESEATAGTASSNNDLVSIVEALQSEREGLKQQVSERDRQIELYKNQYARIAADFENFRKRTQREKEDLENQVKQDTILKLLTVVDDFERARSQIVPKSDGEKAIHKSYQGVYKNLVEGLKRLGVSAMRPEGQPFDPNYHEAMLREATNEYPEDAVIEQLVRGYMLGDRVLRHAMVKVAAPQDPVVTSEEETPTAESDPEI